MSEKSGFPSSMYKGKNKIGEGSYSKVYKYKTYDDQNVAIKKFKKYEEEESYALDAKVSFTDGIFLREVAITKKLNHPNVINILKIEANFDKSNYYIVLPLGDFDLKYLIESNIKYDKHDMCLKITLGLNYMIENNVLNLDTKPQNIIIYKQGSEYNPKIADFGLSQDNICAKNINGVYFTLWYRSPEGLLFNSADEKSETWALACIFCEIYERNPIFPGDSQIDQIFKIFRRLGTPLDYLKELEDNDNIKMNLSMKSPPIWKPMNLKFTNNEILNNLLSKMFIYNPIDRYGIADVLTHDFFDKPHKRSSCESILISNQLILNKNDNMRPLVIKKVEKYVNNVNLMLYSLQIYDSYLENYSRKDKIELLKLCVIIAYYSLKLNEDMPEFTNIKNIEEKIFRVLRKIDYKILFTRHIHFLNLYCDNEKIKTKATKYIWELYKTNYAFEYDTQHLSLLGLQAASKDFKYYDKYTLLDTKTADEILHLL